MKKQSLMMTMIFFAISNAALADTSAMNLSLGGPGRFQNKGNIQSRAKELQRIKERQEFRRAQIAALIKKRHVQPSGRSAGSWMAMNPRRITDPNQ